MPYSVEKLVKAQQKKDDEFYTKYDHVKHIFEFILKDYNFKDKIIYLPCDSERSNFTIYLKEHKDKLGYKELIYTWDDFNTHEDIFRKADIIITNPPFSKLCKEFLPMLIRCRKDFFIIAGSIVGNYLSKFKKANIDVRCLFNKKYCSFLDRNGKDSVINNTYLTTLKEVYLDYVSPQLTKKFSSDKANEERCSGYAHVWSDDYDYGNVKVFDKLIDIPRDIDENFLAPLTIAIESYKICFNNLKEVKLCGYKWKRLDEKKSFVRFFCIVK